MARLDHALYWKYPGETITCDIGQENKVSITQWPEKIPIPTDAEQAAILAEYEEHLAAIGYQTKRATAYPPIGDQLDNVTKALKYLQDKGVDIGPDGTKQVADIEAVKAAFPKPEAKK